jgi:hypothetical protein
LAHNPIFGRPRHTVNLSLRTGVPQLQPCCTRLMDTAPLRRTWSTDVHPPDSVDLPEPRYRELASLLIVSGASDIGEVYAHKTLFEKFVVQDASGWEAEPAQLCHTMFLICPGIEA